VITRRELMKGAAGAGGAAGVVHLAGLAGLAGVVTTAVAGSARADAVAGPMPVALVSHGSPLLAIDPVRGPALRAWGARLPKPAGIVVMTPHYGSRRIELGATGPGVAAYTFPRGLARALPSDLTYPSPPSESLAARVEKQLAGGPGPAIARSARTSLDHTSWMPLLHLCPAADAPVLEIAYPYVPEAELVALGRKLAPLRDEGVLFVASGGVTHNLAAMRIGDGAAAPAPGPAPVPSWSSEFDDWLARTLSARDVDALVDWRARAPAADLAHPDDGAHYRVMLLGAGLVLGGGGAPPVSFPFAGFEALLSVRCAQIG
jgi:4,5-DOPA dioxygenase extradiol